MRVRELEKEQLPGLLELVNSHLSAVAPGWALTAGFLEQNLKRDSTEPVTDPWVVERATLCASDQERVLAAAHLLLYADTQEVGEALRNVGEISWLLSEPGHPKAAEVVLAASRDWISARDVRNYGVAECSSPPLSESRIPGRTLSSRSKPPATDPPTNAARRCMVDG